MRWNVCKYQKADGWHIDGVLVAKEAFLRVTKTFLGDQEAIEKITAPENDYQIKVAHTSEQAREEEEVLLTLKPEAEETRDGYLGYHSYDAATNIYVWIAGGRAAENYTLQEINYTLAGNWHNTNRYRVFNSEAATDRWMDFPAKT